MLGQAGQPTAGVEPHLLCEDDRRTIDEGLSKPASEGATLLLGCSVRGVTDFLPKRLAEGLGGCINSGHNFARVAPEDHS